MNRSNLEKYYMSMGPVKVMVEQGVISKTEFLKAEVLIAEKYCIKKGNLYRMNHLTKPPKRVIYSVTKEEAKNEGKEDNKTRNITQIGKEN